MTEYLKLPFSTDSGIGSAARIGLVVLSSDYTLEHEFRLVFPDAETAMFTSRIYTEAAITPETLSQMEGRITETVGRILPDERLDVVAYGCTSASMVLGNDVVAARVHEAHPEAACTTPAFAALEAFRAIGASRIAVLTPYREDVNQTVQSFIEAGGYEIPVFGSFEEEMDPVVAKIDIQSIRKGIATIIRNHEIDLVFVSCTNVRMLDNVAELEAEFGVPVTSSNHAMAWHTLRMIGNNDQKPGFGSLFTKGIAK